MFSLKQTKTACFCDIEQDLKWAFMGIQKYLAKIMCNFSPPIVV